MTRRSDDGPKAALAAFQRTPMRLASPASSGDDLRRTTLTAPRSVLRDAKILAARLEISLNEIFLLGLDSILRRAGSDPIAGLPDIEDALKIILAETAPSLARGGKLVSSAITASRPPSDA